MTNTKTRRVPVSRRALIQRINRALRSEDEILKKARGARAQQDLGDYYTVWVSRNAIARRNVDLEDLALKLGALQPYEELYDE